MSGVLHDLRFAVRTLRKSPGFAATAVFTLALGIGAATVVFSAVNAVLLQPFPFPKPDRVMLVWETWRDGRSDVSAGNFVEWRDRNRVFEHLAAAQYSNVALAGGEAPERIGGARVTADFFAVFGVKPILGRSFTAEEDEPGREQVVVLSHGLWQRAFGGDPAALGREIRLEGEPYTVIGVLPRDFYYRPNTEELWIPIAFTPERRAMYDEHYLTVFGRLRPEVSPEQARAEMSAVAAQVAEEHPFEDAERGAGLGSLFDEIVGPHRPRLLSLLGAVALVLLIACTNVAHVQLARAAVRSREIAIRAAIGASRTRIVRLLLTESLVLALAAAVVGVALAAWGVDAIVGLAPPGVPRLEQVRIDGSVLAFACAVAALSCVAFGLAPALHLARADLREGLSEGGRSGTSSARRRSRRVLVAAEVALALVLLVGAGLLVRSAIALHRVDPGFDPSATLTARVTLPRVAYPEAAQVEGAFRRVVEEFAGAPGVEAAAVVSEVPLGSGGNSNGLIPEGRLLDPTSAINTRLRIITSDYFAAMRIPVKRGRTFAEYDLRSGTLVMIVNEAFARLAWPGEDPIGKRVACCEGGPQGPSWKVVVGVVGDVRWSDLRQEPAPEFFLPIGQVPPEAWDWIQRTMTVVVRGSGDPAMLTPAVRQAVAAVDRSVPVYATATMGQYLARALAESRFNTLLFTVVGVIGLVLATIGIYGVIAYFVSQRAQEMGIRMALGATAADVRALVTREGMRPVLIGIAIGTLAALGLTRVIRALLYGVPPEDAVTFAGVVALLIAIAWVACQLPARRATRIAPMSALRAE